MLTRFARDNHRSMVKIVFRVDREILPTSTERVWAKPLGGHRYRIENIPFLVRGVSLYDTVKALTVNRELRAVRVVERGGHSTFRLLLQQAVLETAKSAEFFRFWDPLKRLGCVYERADTRFLVMDVPSDAEIQSVLKALDTGEQEGFWEYTVAHCEHITPLK